MSAIEIPNDLNIYDENIINRDVWDVTQESWNHIVENGEEDNVISFHPMIGGSAVKCGYNLININQYYGTFFGSWEITKKQNKTNGSNTYMNFGLKPSEVAPDSNLGISIGCLETGNLAQNYDVGSIGDSARYYLMLKSNGDIRFRVGADTIDCRIPTRSPKGIVTALQFSNQRNLYRNGILERTAENQNNLSTRDIYYGAINNEGNALYSSNSLSSLLIFKGNARTAEIIYQAQKILESGLNRLQDNGRI